VSRNASNAATTGSGRAPTAADYNAALNSSNGLEKDVTISTFLYDDEANLPPSANRIEMNTLSLNHSSGAATSSDRHSGTAFSATDRQHNMVSFSDAEELDERHQMAATSPSGDNAVRSKPGLKSYLSVEHLDTMDDNHHHHRRHHHHDDSIGSNHPKRRKFRGKIGGLHRNRDSGDAEDDAEVAALSAAHEPSEQRHLSPAVQSTDSDHGGWGAPGAATNDSGANRPIYKKSGDVRPTQTQRPAMQIASVDPTTVRGATPSMSVNSFMSDRINLPVLTPEEPPLSRRVATSEWVAQQQKSVSPSTDVAASRLQPQQPTSARATGGGDSRRTVVTSDDEILGDTSRQGSVGGRRSKSQSARGAPSASSSSARNRPDNDVRSDAAAVPTDQSRARAPRISGRRVPNSAILDTSHSTEI